MHQDNETTSRFYDAFQATISNLNGSGWTSGMRAKAFDQFAAHGTPTRRHEEWKYVDLRWLSNFELVHAPSVVASAAERAEQVLSRLCRPQASPGPETGPRPTSARLVFVDGRYIPELSEPIRSGNALVIPLSEAVATRRDLVEPHLGSVAASGSNPFTALNTGLFQDGAFVYLEEGQVLEHPVHVLHVSAGTSATVSHPRHLFVVGGAAQARVLEEYASSEPKPHFCNPVTEIRLADGAILDHYKTSVENVSSYHIGSTFVRQERDSQYISNSLVHGGRIVRNDLHCNLAGEGADCTMNGLNVLCGSQFADDHTSVVHGVPHCTSREYYKTVLDEQSEGVFNGKVFVLEGAQKTSAEQTNKNLLLSKKSLMNSKPQLEIFADDVKCSHGATTGQLDRDALYYLRARGIDLSTARSILTEAFASDVVTRFPYEPIRERIRSMLTFPLCRRAGHPIEKKEQA